MDFAPIVNPGILTEALVIAYSPRTGDYTGSCSQAQFAAAMCMAEQFAQDEISAPLVEQTFTGSFGWLRDEVLVLPTVHNTQLINVSVIGPQGIFFGPCCGCGGFTFTSGVCVTCGGTSVSISDISSMTHMYDGRLGYLRLGPMMHHMYASPHDWTGFVQVVWKAAAPSGMVNAPTTLLALSMATKLFLEQIVQPEAAEGGPGSPGVTQYSALGYSEQRRFLRETAFGDSAVANFIAKCLGPLKIKRALRVR